MANRRLDPGHREPLWYIWKSHRHLHWASQDLRAMMSAGDNPDRPKMEKAFFNLLTSVNVARESLEAASDELDLGGAKRGRSRRAALEA